jgi:hypothetical protein
MDARTGGPRVPYLALVALLVTPVAGCARFVTPHPRDAGLDAPAPVDGPRAEAARDTARADRIGWDQTVPDRRLADSSREAPAPVDGPRAEVARDTVRHDERAPDQKLPDIAKPADITKPDVSQPDAPVEVGTYTFDFSGPLSGWTQVSGSFTVSGGQLVANKGGDNRLERSISFDRSQGTIRMKGALTSLDCRGANLTLLDGTTEVLLLALDYCAPAYGGSGGRVVFNLAGAVHDVTWAADMSPHILEVSFANGSYALRLDGAVLKTAAGPARLKATTLRIGGWIANYPPGTPFDDVYLGP